MFGFKLFIQTTLYNCITLYRLCKQINQIETVACGTIGSQIFCNLKSYLEESIKSANQENTYRNNNLKDMAEETKQILADIDKYEELLIKKIRYLANISRENILKAHAKHQDAVNADIKELDSVMSGLKNSLNHINRDDMNEVEAFITMKNCQITLKEVTKVVADLSNNWLQTSLFYKMNDKLIAQEITALGEVVEETKKSPVFHLQLNQSIYIACQTDTNKCSINGICQLPDNTVVITDANNAKLKRLRDNLEVKDYIDLNDTPECMCVTKPHEVAIVLRKRNQVQFVTIDEHMTLESSFPIVEGKCTKIDSGPTENTVYVCCIVECEMKLSGKVMPIKEMTHKYHIIVYNKKGECLSIYNNEEVASQHFYEPLKILVSVDTFDLIDADTSKYTFSKRDIKQKPTRTSYSSYDLRYNYYFYARYSYVCMLSAEKIIFVHKNGEMSLISLNGRQQQKLKIEDSSPVLAVLFNKKKSTLIVALRESCQIKEYKMGPKMLYLLKE
jgi:DNA-binding protein H-NS